MRDIVWRLPSILRLIFLNSDLVKAVRYRFLYYGRVNYKANVICAKKSLLNIESKSWIGAYSDIVLLGESILQMGARTSIGRYCEIGGHDSKITVGSDTSIQDRCTITGVVSIGRSCIFSKDVLMGVGKHHFANQPHLTIRDQDEIQAEKEVFIDPIIIEDDCFIGCGVHIKHGVTLAKGTVVGANAVVSRNFPPYSVIGGVPAELIKKRLEYEPPRQISVDEELTFPYFYNGFNMQLPFVREDIKRFGGVSVDGVFSIDLKVMDGDSVILKIGKKAQSVFFVVFNNETHELSIEISECKFTVDSKKDEEKLIFKIVDESGQTVENSAVLWGAWVC